MCLIKLTIYKPICVFTPKTMLTEWVESLLPRSKIPGDWCLLTLLQVPKSEFPHKKTYKSYPQISRSFKMRKSSQVRARQNGYSAFLCKQIPMTLSKAKQAPGNLS